MVIIVAEYKGFFLLLFQGNELMKLKLRELALILRQL